MSEMSSAPLERILRGKVPTFLIHRSAQLSSRLPEVVTELTRAHGESLGLGGVVKVWNTTPGSLQSQLAAFGATAIRIADPVLHRHPASAWPGMQEIDEHKREPAFDFYKDLPSGIDRRWISKVLKAQRDAGATVFLSATGWVGTTNAADSLDQSMAAVRESRDALSEGSMFVNLTLDREWLINRELRNLLLREIVESNERNWYLRFWWPELKNPYGQLSDPDILRGYVKLTETAKLEDKNLILPNSGLTGWLMSSLGALGFSTGPSSTDQAFARQRRIARPAGRPASPAIPRIFDDFTMHTMEHAVFERLRGLPGHNPSATKFLDEIDSGSHSRELAGLHYVNAVGNLQARLSVKERRKAAKRLISAGSSWLNSLADVDRPAGANHPAHLSAWSQLL